MRQVLSPKTKIVDRRFLVDAVVLSQQVVIEPAELESSCVDARLRPEFSGDVVDAFVRPGPITSRMNGCPGTLF